ncbi:J domain-containing protein [Sarcoptes scabiei]|uniref:J domain-containing protein n=1 Tax=Sarcoptes scabiei TaxID=52283 RepID=A0A834RGR9_SARSC|nr:J domain-containing protein [Sarcoptes scabiei]
MNLTKLGVIITMKVALAFLTEQILSEFRFRALRLHPDKAKSEKDRIEREKQFRKLSIAKDSLTDPEKRKNYDRWKESGLKISFSKWNSLTNQRHSTFHWKTSNDCNRAIENGENFDKIETKYRKSFTNSSYKDPIRSFRENRLDGNRFEIIDSSSDEILKKFRNYQI